MWESIFVDNNAFRSYGYEHAISFIFWILVGVFILYSGRNYWSEKQQRNYITLFCVLIWMSQMSKVVIRYYLGNFDQTADLPLQLCNILPFAMPFVMYNKSRYWWGIFFFLIIGGTFQSLLTPTLRDSFPHYENIRYWTVHAGLTIVALYGVFAYRWKPNFKDALRSAIFINVIAALMYPINILLDSNYLYLREKPPGDNLYSILGPWPWYFLSLEVVLLVVFSIIMIPFYVTDKIKKRT